MWGFVILRGEKQGKRRRRKGGGDADQGRAITSCLGYGRGKWAYGAWRGGFGICRSENFCEGLLLEWAASD